MLSLWYRYNFLAAELSFASDVCDVSVVTDNSEYNEENDLYDNNYLPLKNIRYYNVQFCYKQAEHSPCCMMADNAPSEKLNPNKVFLFRYMYVCAP